MNLVTNAKMQGGAEFFAAQNRVGKAQKLEREDKDREPVQVESFQQDLLVPSPKLSRQAQRAAANLGGIVELRVTSSHDSKGRQVLSGLGADPAKSYGNYPLSAMYTSDRNKLQHPETRSNTFQLKSDGGIVTMKSAQKPYHELNTFEQQNLMPSENKKEYKTMSSFNKGSNSRQPNN